MRLGKVIFTCTNGVSVSRQISFVFDDLRDVWECFLNIWGFFITMFFFCWRQLAFGPWGSEITPVFFYCTFFREIIVKLTFSVKLWWNYSEIIMELYFFSWNYGEIIHFLWKEHDIHSEIIMWNCNTWPGGSACPIFFLPGERPWNCNRPAGAGVKL